VATYVAQGTGKSEDWIIEADPNPSYEWFSESTALIGEIG
jgi:hypothetical protein